MAPTSTLMHSVGMVLYAWNFHVRCGTGGRRDQEIAGSMASAVAIAAAHAAWPARHCRNLPRPRRASASSCSSPAVAQEAATHLAIAGGTASAATMAAHAARRAADANTMAPCTRCEACCRARGAAPRRCLAMRAAAAAAAGHSGAQARLIESS